MFKISNDLIYVADALMYLGVLGLNQFPTEVPIMAV